MSSPRECKSHFSPERWEKYKADVRFFRIAPDKSHWADMQKDHGLNPPPVFTILGRGFGELRGATTGYLQLLAGIDLVDLAGMFVAPSGPPGGAALTQLTWITFRHDDDKSTVLTLLSLVLCSGMIYAFAPGAHSRGSSGRGRAAQIR
ncbi:MAG: hypothetical protein ABI134_01290 [Byssovorax sp.]